MGVFAGVGYIFITYSVTYYSATADVTTFADNSPSSASIRRGSTETIEEHPYAKAYLYMV